MSTDTSESYLLGQIQKMLVVLGIPGVTDVRMMRKLDDTKNVRIGIKILKISRQGKTAVIARDHQGNAYLYSLASDILKPKDIRILLSSNSKVTDYFYPIEEPGVEAALPAPAAPISLLEELRLLEKKFRADKRVFPAPPCVERLRKIRRFCRHFDKLIARAKALTRKAQSLHLQAQRASERADIATAKALRSLAARIEQL